MDYSTPSRIWGCVTAKSVLNTPRADLINKADLEEETVDNVLDILRAEFDDTDETHPSAPQADAVTEEQAPEAEATANEAEEDIPAEEQPEPEQ